MKKLLALLLLLSTPAFALGGTSGTGTGTSLTANGGSINSGSSPITGCTNGQILYNNNGVVGCQTPVAMSGDVTSTSGGVTTVGAIGTTLVTGNGTGVSVGSSAAPSGVLQVFAPVNTAALTLTGNTDTASTNVLNITETWNNAGATFDAPLKMTVTNTASGAASKLVDLLVGVTPEFTIDRNGSVVAAGSIRTQNNGNVISFGASNDAILARKGAANIQLGSNDAAAPVAQTLSVQSVVTATSNTAGANFTINGSAGTGTGAGGSIIIQTAPATGSGSTPNAQVAALTITSAGLVQINAITSDATHTDTSVCQDSSTHALYSGSGTLGVCLGTSSKRFKTDIKNQTVGLEQLMKLSPKDFRYIAGHGDNGVKQQRGFIAEDVVSIIPDLVGFDEKGLPNSVDMMGMLPVVILAVQQQQREIEAATGAFPFHKCLFNLLMCPN